MNIKRICVVGPGAVGGMLAVLLQKAGFTVSVLARPERARFIQTNGITLRMKDLVHCEKPHAAAESGELGFQDLVIVTVKGDAAVSIAPALTALCGPQTSIVFVMNGVPWWFLDGFGGAAAGARLKSLPAANSPHLAELHSRIVWGVIQCGVSEVSMANVVHAHSQAIVLGRPDNTVQGLEAIAAIFDAAGYKSTVSSNIRQDIWNKLMINMVVNPINALTAANIDALLSDDNAKGLIFAMSEEGRALAVKLGLNPGPEPGQRFGNSPARGTGAKTSMLQDLERGRPLEINGVIGAVVEMADLLDHPMPFTKAVLGLLRARAGLVK